MIDKIVYLSYQPLTPKFYKDFYIQNCIDENINAEYWDMSKLFYPHLDLGESLCSDIIISITTYKELKLCLSKVDSSKTLFIVHINYRFNVIRLFALLTRFNCKLAFFGRGAFPILPKKMGSKLLEVISRFDFNRFFMGLGSRMAGMLKHYHIVKKYDIIFNAGSEGYNVLGAGNLSDYQNAKIVEINYYDYDLYLSTAREKRIIEGDYCVFLDEYLPLHPDFAIINGKTVTAAEYYPFINIYFDYIEANFNTKVIIAAHPKAYSYKDKNPFNNREIVFNQTCLLTRDSKFVITSHSTSFSFALFYKKPIVFITSNPQKIKMYLEYEFTKYMAELLNCKFVYFDDFHNDGLFFPVDEEKYDNYKYKYLTSKEAENKISSEIFIDSILKL